jgi:putative transposase
VEELQESFWGDLQGEAQRAAKRLFELLSERQRDRYMVNPRHGRSPKRKDHRNGYYLRDFVTRFGTLRLRIARSRKRGFLPEVIGKFQRRAEEVCLLILLRPVGSYVSYCKCVVYYPWRRSSGG